MAKSKSKGKGGSRRARRDELHAHEGVVLGNPASFSFRSAMGFPKKLHVNHAYTDTASVAITPSGSFQFSANGLFDPNITSVGHQPMYFDNLSAIYDHYTVLRSRIVVELLPDTIPYNVVLYVDDDTSIASFGGAAEQPSSTPIHAVLPQSAKPLRLTRSWDANAYFGGDILDNDNLQGTASANPTEQSYFTLVGLTTTGASGSMSFSVRIEYEAVWDELKTQAQS